MTLLSAGFRPLGYYLVAAAICLIDAIIAWAWGVRKLFQEKHLAPEMTSAQGMSDGGTRMQGKKERNKDQAHFMKLLDRMDHTLRLMAGVYGEKKKDPAQGYYQKHEEPEHLYQPRHSHMCRPFRQPQPEKAPDVLFHK